MGVIFRMAPIVPLQIVRFSRTADTGLINGSAAPLATISIEASSDLSQPFAAIGSVSCDATGGFHYDDADATTYSMRFTERAPVAAGRSRSLLIHSFAFASIECLDLP